ncbi:10369_t:CDS:2 [Gigaspora margarita]|uniref:10369_t:CDS:1 n=1 Tax=Gigaspora margarita TaxID=4874 RepID=A0ABN7VKT2_GIGMA|nr:10369_t:CDS:2 [Gigaspora margarita]
MQQSCTQADKNSETNSSVLDKILDEMGDENHAITWENINTRLESIFGCDKILNIPEETQKNKYSIKLWKEKAENTFGSFEEQSINSLNKSKKRVSFKEPEIARKKLKQVKKMSTTRKGKKLLIANNDLVHTPGWKTVAKLILNPKLNIEHNDDLKYDSLQFKFGLKQKEYVHIDFGKELGSVEEGLKMWSSIDENIEKVYAEVKLQRFCHFLKLYDAYVVLFQLAIKEPSSSNQKISIKQKKDSGIPLGITAPFRSIRGWVGYRMKSFLQIKSRGERRFWTAICHIRFILHKNLATVKQLVNSGASLYFFQLLSDEDFNNFLILIANEKPVNFNPPNKINNILDRQRVLELKFNENGSVIVTRTISDLVKRPLRNKKNISNVKEKYENIDS